MQPASPAATAASQPLHGVFLGGEANGLTVIYVYLHGDVVRWEPVYSDRAAAMCAELEAWLSDRSAARPHLRLVR